MSEYLPCPLCGSEAQDRNVSRETVSCSNMGCWMFYTAIPRDEWQRRPREEALTEQIKRLTDEAAEAKYQLEQHISVDHPYSTGLAMVNADRWMNAELVKAQKAEIERLRKAASEAIVRLDNLRGGRGNVAYIDKATIETVKMILFSALPGAK